mgnify:FL=1
MNALAPAEVAKIVLDEEQSKIEVVVPDEQLSLAIGRRGQNVRLASMLTGWDIDILTEEEESERRQKEFLARSARFIEALDIDEVIAHLLVTEGFSSVEEVAYVPLEDVSGIEGFDDELAAQLQQRAQNFLEAESARLTDRRRELGVTEELVALPGLTPQMLIKLGENGVKTMEDFADLASDELTDPEDGYFASFEMREAEANELIMQARIAAGWFTEEELRAAELEKLAAEEKAQEESALEKERAEV